MVKRRRKNPGINNLLVIILLIFIFILIAIILFNLSEFFSVIELKTLYAKLNVSNREGFDINGSALIFGEITRLGSASREIFVENNRNESVRIKIYSTGDISAFLGRFDNDFILHRNETRKVGFSVYVPGNAEYGVYEGRIIIEVRKLNFNL